LSDGLDAFVFTFSFFGLRTSRFDFCCLDMGWVTSVAGRPALGDRRCGLPLWAVDRNGRSGRDSAGWALRILV
jgi:hypothetical protein